MEEFKFVILDLEHLVLLSMQSFWICVDLISPNAFQIMSILDTFS